jgi:hypothetical protein
MRGRDLLLQMTGGQTTNDSLLGVLYQELQTFLTMLDPRRPAAAPPPIPKM